MRKGWKLRAAYRCAAVVLAMVSGGTQAVGKTVLIGFAAPMSGLSGSTGVSLERAAQLAIDDVNQSKPVIGGEPVVFKLLPQDDRADQRTAELIARYFVKSNVSAVVGHWNSGVSIPASKIYAAAGIAQVSPASTSVKYTQQGFRTTFRVVPHDGDGARHTAMYVVNELRASKIVLIDDRTLFGAGYADNFAQTAAALKGPVVSRFAISAKSSDFNSILRSARTLHPDVIVFAGIDAQAAQLASEIRRAGIKAPLVGIGGVVGPTFLSLAGDNAEGMTVVEPGPAVYKGPQWGHFERSWKAKYKEPIYLYAPFAYDAVRVIVAAMQEANSTDNAKVVDTLHGIRYRGITGNLGFDKDGNLVDPTFTLFQVKGGQWRAIRTMGEKN